MREPVEGVDSGVGEKSTPPVGAQGRLTANSWGTITGAAGGVPVKPCDPVSTSDHDTGEFTARRFQNLSIK